MSAAAAKAAVSEHLTADPAVTATVVNGSPDKLAQTTVVVTAGDTMAAPHKDSVQMAVTGYVRGQQASVLDRDLTALMDSLMASVRAMRQPAAAGAPHWLGISTDIAYSEPEAFQQDGKNYATADLEFTVVVPRDVTRTVGASEQAVRDVLTAGGHTVTDGSDVPPFVTTRWAGNDAVDTLRDEIIVVCATEVESGEIETFSRNVWLTLHASDRLAVLDRIDIDLAGTPPGALASYETAVIMTTVLTAGELSWS